MTYQRLVTFGLFLPVFAAFSIGCSSQSFGIGGFPTDGGDSSDAGDVADVGTLSDGGQQPIDPIGLLYSWTYSISVAGTYPACANGIGTSAVSAEQTVGGRDAFSVSSFCSGVGSYFYSQVGDEVSEYIGDAWVTALDTPVQDGHTWSNGTETFVWKNAGNVTVTAGSFGDCWEADLQDHPEIYAVTFCRGIGPVKWHVRDASGVNGYDAVLTAKTP